MAAQCLGPNQCATVFPGPTGLGASFNRDLWTKKGEVMSTELRAFANARWYRGRRYRRGQTQQPEEKWFVGTSAFGPNLNIIRDPRYGRNSELPSEDPMLTGAYGVAYVNALQERDSAGHPRTMAYIKHFTAYSTEARPESTIRVPLFAARTLSATCQSWAMPSPR